VISDGKEYGSTAKYKDVVRYLQTNKIAVYATMVGDPTIPGLGFIDRIHLPFQMRDNILPLYAGATGGQIDPEFRTPSIARSFAKIAEEVRTQYMVGYYTHEPFIDGKYRKLEVKVLRSEPDRHCQGWLLSDGQRLEAADDSGSVALFQLSNTMCLG